MSPAVAILAIVASYALGTLPSAIVVARARGIDIMATGSGNPGASNVARALGAKWGILVFGLDAMKGAVPVAVALGNRELAYACGAAAIVGHIFPVTRRLKGGKGIATGAGVLLVLHPVVLLAVLATWMVIMKVSKKASLASIIVVPLVLVGLAVKGAPGWEFAAFIGIALLIEVRHVSNIKRLFSGTEPPVTGVAR